MASYTTVPTHSPGDTLSADDWNDVANNLNTFTGTGIGARIFNSNNVATTSTLAVVTMDSERYDTDSMHSGSSSHLVFQTAGLYTVTANVEWQVDSGSNPWAQMAMRINGSTVYGKNMIFLQSGHVTPQTMAMQYQAAASDYVELMIASNNSITVNNTSAYSPELMAARH